MKELRVIGRKMKGVHVEGYALFNKSNGSTRICSRDELLRLVVLGHVENCTAQSYKGRTVIKGVGMKLAELPKCNEYGRVVGGSSQAEEQKQYTLTGRVVEGKNIRGYRISYYDNNNVAVHGIVDRDCVVRMAGRGMISNARIQRCDGSVLLRGIGCNLSRLPVINYLG